MFTKQKLKLTAMWSALIAGFVALVAPGLIAQVPANVTAIGCLYQASPGTVSDNQFTSVKCDTNGQLLVSGGGGGGGGGTSSNFGSAVPTAGTAAGFSDGTNMQAARVKDYDSGAGTDYVVGVGVRYSASGGSIAQTTGNGTVDAGTPRFTIASDSTGNFGVAQGSSTTGQIGPLSQAAVTTADPSYGNGETRPISLLPSGAMRVSVRAPIGAFSTGSIASGAIASGAIASGAIASGAVASGAYASGSIGSGAMVDVGAQADAACGSDTGTCSLIALTKRNNQNAAAPQALTVGGATTAQIGCTSVAKYDASTSGSTQLVSLTASNTIRICGYTIRTGGTAANVKLVSGTGTNCGTGASDITPAFQLTTNDGQVDRSPVWQGLAAVISEALCINSSAAAPVQAIVYYTKY